MANADDDAPHSGMPANEEAQVKPEFIRPSSVVQRHIDHKKMGHLHKASSRSRPTDILTGKPKIEKKKNHADTEARKQ